jgi:hypothetical protein
VGGAGARLGVAEGSSGVTGGLGTCPGTRIADTQHRRITSKNPSPPQPKKTKQKVHRVSLDEFRKLMLGGDMLLPSITTGFMALEKLREEGLL